MIITKELFFLQYRLLKEKYVQTSKAKFKKRYTSLLAILYLIILNSCSDVDWIKQTENLITAGPKLYNNNIYINILSNNGYRQLAGYRAMNGDELWKINLPTRSDCLYLEVDFEKIIVGCENVIFAYHESSGKQAWILPIDGIIENKLILNEKILTTAIRTKDNSINLLRVDIETGEAITETQFPEGSSFFSWENTLLVVIKEHSILDQEKTEPPKKKNYKSLEKKTDINEDNALWVAIDNITGQTLWIQVAKDNLNNIISTKSVTLGLNKKYLFKININNGFIEWKQDIEGALPPISIESFVCIVKGSSIIGLDGITGKSLWTTTIHGVLTQPLIVDDRVFLYSVSGKFYSLSSVDGKLLWSISAPPPGKWFDLSKEFYVSSTENSWIMIDLQQQRLILEDEIKSFPKPGFSGLTPLFANQRQFLLSGNRLYAVGSNARLFMKKLD